MTLPRTTAAFVIALFAGTIVNAQVVISNEKLATTTLVVNKSVVTADCATVGCSARKRILTSIPVTCPASLGQTCTFHIEFDAKAQVYIICTPGCLGSSGSTNAFQFLVDGSAPLPGPTDDEGNYIFSRYSYSYSTRPAGAPYVASVVATVTNSSSQNHTIDVNLGCEDTLKYGGCQVTANWSTMRVDVFEP